MYSAYHPRVIGIYTCISIKDALLARTFDQLVSVRNEKKKRIESFFTERTNDIQNLIRNIRKDIYAAEQPLIYESRELKPDSTPTLIIADKTIRENGNEAMVLLEISMESINQIMFENNPSNGLGKTGEAYLVGKDLLMRSSSRFQENSVYKTRVNTKAVQLAFDDSIGIEIIKDYRNVPVLSSFGKVETGRTTRAVVSEIDYAEAMVPIAQIRNNIFYLENQIAYAHTYIFATQYVI